MVFGKSKPRPQAREPSPPQQQQMQQQRGNEGYEKLKAEDLERKEWVKRAHKSDCAKSIDALFGGKFPAEKVIQLKSDIFEQIYTSMGEEVDPDDILRAVVVHYQKFNMIFTVLLSILTLGLFLLFKPRDDDTVLVLTKRDRRVLTIRKERTNFCEGRNSGAVLMFARYLVFLFLVLSIPGLLYIIFWESTHPTVGADESIIEEIMDHENDVLHFYDLKRKKKTLKTWFIAVVLFIFAFWLYTNVPRGTHGRRTQMNYSANNLCCAQFTHTGGGFRRRGELRLFFGKYPTQAVLDLGGTISWGQVAGPVPPSELGRKGFSTPALLTFLTLALSVITIMDSGFSWADRSVAFGHMAFSMQFCREATTKRLCNQRRCRAWAKLKGTTSEFCSGVTWMNHIQDGDDNFICFTDTGGEPPCCSGCEKYMFVHDGYYKTFRSAISLIGDFGTLVFSYMAAKIALGYMNQSGEVQVVFERRHMLKKQTADVDFTRPLTLMFLDSVFNNATDKPPPDGSSFTDSSSGEDPAYGVRHFENSTVTDDWDDFIKNHKLIEVQTKDPARLSMKVHVPTKCLGLLPREEVIAAWGELPDLFPGPMPYLLCAIGAIQHAVILTNRRTFYVRVRRRFFFTDKLGKDVRVDIFRHDCDIFFGRMNSTVRPALFRLFGAKWRPGDIFLQDRYGVLAMSRNHGNALNLFNTVWQISRVNRFIERKDVEEAGIDWSQCVESVEGSLTRKPDQKSVWTLAKQPNDHAFDDPELHLADEDEQPLFTWSFTERGSVSSPFSYNHSIMVSTGRVFMWTRGWYKPFDCRICCMWSFLWCNCVQEMANRTGALFWTERVPSTMSFMTLPSILSFSTERQVEPPLCCCYDPMHPSWQCPLWEEICSACTRCIRREDKCLRFDKEEMSKVPGRAGPRTHLMFFFRLKQQVQEQDLEVACSMSPCAMPEDEDSDGEDMARLKEMVEVCAIPYSEQTAKVRMLWKLLGVALRTFDKERLPS